MERKKKNTCVLGKWSHTEREDKTQTALRGFNVAAGACAIDLIMYSRDHDMAALSDCCFQGDPAVTGLSGERWNNPRAQSSTRIPPPHPPNNSLGSGSGSKSTPDQRCQPRGNKWAVSSSLFMSIGDLPTCFASLLLYVMIKYCLSAQLIPKAKGKSLCPRIICKPSLSPRTDLFTGWESVLYYTAVTLPCLSSLFNVMPSHSRCSVWGLHISLLMGEKKGG